MKIIKNSFRATFIILLKIIFMHNLLFKKQMDKNKEILKLIKA